MEAKKRKVVLYRDGNGKVPVEDWIISLRDLATILLLLMGGDKSSQRSDIYHAEQNWKDFKNGKRA